MAIIKRTIESTEQWKAWRGDLVGASDVGAILGCHEYKTYFGLYQEKIGKLKTTQTKIMSDGLIMQEAALKTMQRDYPELKAFDPKAHYADAELGVGATPDVQAEKDGEVGTIQIKWVDRDIFRKTWQVTPPLWIALQVTQEAWLSGAKWAQICAFVQDHGNHLHFYDVEIRQDVIEMIKAEVKEFWRRVWEQDPPPPDYHRDAEVIRAVYPQDDGSEIDLTGDNEIPAMLVDRRRLKDLASESERDAKAIDSELLHKLGKAMIGRFNGGYVSAKTIHRAAHEVKASSYRMLRVVIKEQ